MLIFFIWLILSFVIAGAASDKSIGYWGGFFCCLLLSPIIGLIIILVSGPKAQPLPRPRPVATTQKITGRAYQIDLYDKLIKQAENHEKMGNNRRALSDYLDAERALVYLDETQKDESIELKLEDIVEQIARVRELLK